MTVRTMIVEDFPAFRRAIRSILDGEPSVCVVCEVADGLEAVQNAVELKPDLILLDIGLPTLDGIEVARRLSALVPRSKIIILSLEASPGIVKEAMSAGASGYVFKLRMDTDLLPMIDAVLSAKPFLGST